MNFEARLLELEARMSVQEQRLTNYEKHMLATQQLILEQLEANTTLTKKVSADTEGIRDLWNQSIGALNLFNKLMWLVKRILWVVVGIIFVFWGVPYMLAHNGELPAWLKATMKSLLL